MFFAGMCEVAHTGANKCSRVRPYAIDYAYESVNSFTIFAPAHHNFQRSSMNNPSQPPQPAQPDMALLLLGSFFEDLHHAPVRDDAKLDALAMQILDGVRRRCPDWLSGLARRSGSAGICGRYPSTASRLSNRVFALSSTVRCGIDCDRRAPHCSADAVIIGRS